MQRMQRMRRGRRMAKNERAESGERGEREGRASEARAATWLARWPPHHLLTTRPTPPSLPTSASPPTPRHTCPHHAIHTHQCSLAHPLADSAIALPAPTSTRLPRVCSGAVLAHADAAVARATRLANTLQSRPRLAERGDRPGSQACDASDSSRAGQPGATHSALKRILQLAWWRPSRGSTAAGVQAAQEGGCLGRRMAMPPSPTTISTQPGRAGRD